jgi:beta-glucanase (GH16 family)
VYIEDGMLVLRTQREAVNGYEFTSGGVQTQGKNSWKGPARACVSAILPGIGGGNGIWPAHWMMPDGTQAVPLSASLLSEHPV